MPTSTRPVLSTEGLDLTAEQLNYLVRIKNLVGVECYSPATTGYEHDLYVIWNGRVRLNGDNLHLMCYYRRRGQRRWGEPRAGMPTMHRVLTPVEEL